MKVFLSHSTKDKDFVLKLAQAMEAGGFDPWRCEDSIQAQADWIEEIEKGLKAADVVLLIWSPDAAASYPTMLEYRATLAREITLKRLRLGVVLLRDCELPELLLTRQYIDARHDSDKAIAGVLAWLNGRRELGRLAGVRNPVLLEEYPTDEFFVGRTNYLAQLRAAFSQQTTNYLLHGEPGTGKTTLALRFAWGAQQDFDAVIFQRCGQRSTDVIISELAYKLRQQLGEDVTALPPESKLAAVSDWLRARQSLLVLDDVWSEDVRQLEPGAPCSALYTSRMQSLPWIHDRRAVQVVSFSPEECEALFHAKLDGQLGNADVARHRDGLIDFARNMEMLPIAVAVGASLLRKNWAIGIEKGLKRLKPETLTYGGNVPELFRKAIEAQNEREQRLLNAAAVCVQEGFWLPLAAEIAGLSEQDAEDAAGTLVFNSLMQKVEMPEPSITGDQSSDRQRFHIHALLHNRARALLGDDGVQALQERHAAALEKLFKDWETRWRECWECLEEIMPAAGFLWANANTSRQAWITYWGYATAQRVGEMDAALRILQQEESFWRGRDDRAARDALQRSYGNQALILAAWGRLDEALALHKKEEALCLELGNKDGLQASYGNQALILKAWGRLDEALALHKQEEAICLELGNKDGLQRSYGNQALILKAWGRLDDALALHKKEEAICLELGNKDGEQASYGNQADIFIQQGRLQEALELLTKKEAICVELSKKSSLGHCCWTWARLEAARGDRPAQKQKLQQALALFTELNMPMERDKVQSELDQHPSSD